jgi:hypothetical protein
MREGFDPLNNGPTESVIPARRGGIPLSVALVAQSDI